MTRVTNIEKLKRDLKGDCKREHVLAHYDIYQQGWNDAINAVCEELRRQRRVAGEKYLKEHYSSRQEYMRRYYETKVKPKRQAERAKRHEADSV